MSIGIQTIIAVKIKLCFIYATVDYATQNYPLKFYHNIPIKVFVMRLKVLTK